jgi:hypothetical protein
MKMSEAIGKKIWAFAAGCIPLVSTGKEPGFTSHDKVAILNTSDREADIRVTIFYEGDKPVKDYSIKVQAQRVRKIRFNDLIDPLPVPLGKRFAFVLESDKNVIVQFSRVDTSSRSAAGFCVTPFYDE